MVQFDIQMLDAIEPPRFHCAKCLALFWEPARSLNLDIFEECTTDRAFRERCPQCRSGQTDHTHPLCPVCQVRYVSASPDVSDHLDTFLLSRHPSPWDPHHRNTGWGIRFLQHCQHLGAIATSVHRGRCTPGAALLQALAAARAFVHCLSFGTFASEIMQVLCNTAEQVPVRGVIAESNSYAIEYLLELRQEYPQLILKPQQAKVYLGDVQYQQLFVIDGLIAFRGSANEVLFDIETLLHRKAVLDVITESEAVFTLHNRYFSPAWAQESQEQDVILMA